MSDKLVPTGKLGPVKIGLAAKLQHAQQQGRVNTELFDYTKYPNRIVLCIDDSGSMSSIMEPATPDSCYGNKAECPCPSHSTRIEMCRKACEEFLNVCDSRDTALGMYTISTGREYSLSVAYPMLLGKIREMNASGGTPTISTLNKIIKKENATRVVLVSDGESGAADYIQNGDSEEYPYSLNSHSKQVLDVYKEKKVLIDTVFIGTQGDENTAGYWEMQLIAEYTGGLFMFFKEGESFRTKFKYLAPAFRGMLVAGDIKI